MDCGTDDGQKHVDVLPKGYSARTGVHEYGGAAFAVGVNGGIVFADWETKGVYSLSPGSRDCISLLEADPEVYYADFDIHPINSALILAVQENHHPKVVENSIVLIDALSRKWHTIASGADFYSHPKFSAEGDKVCWLQWNHPDMPWTGSLLYVGSWDGGAVSDAKVVAGEPGKESISQPRWLPDGSLLFASDRSGYYQLYLLDPGQRNARHINLHGLSDVEFAGPEWVLGTCTYVSLSKDKVAAIYTKNGTENLILIDINSDTFTDLQLEIVSPDFFGNTIRRVSDTAFVVIGSKPKNPPALYHVDVQDSFKMTLLKTSADVDIPLDFYSTAEHISFPIVYGDERDGHSHALYLPPKNPNYHAPADSLPPLIISLHGGPTGHVSPGLSLALQYFTSRGYALASVDYAGSSGYGRAYRERLDGKWGIRDIDDVASCVSYLASTGKIDQARVGVTGGSAGGYGTLQSLCRYPSMWAGGVSLYGIADLKTMAATTHKFESHYLDGLLFPKGASHAEKEKLLKKRSPLFRARAIKAPVLLLQGSEDKVVPPDQASDMMKIIESNGGDVKLVLMEGEGHGFRMGENIKKAINEEDDWWAKTLLK